MIKLEFDNSDEQLVAALRAKGPLIIESLKTRLDLLDLKLQSHIVADKLSGQVLAHRTGTLANSIRMIPASVDGDTLNGAVEGGGGPAWYGRIHEYGTTRSFEIVPNTKKALAFLINGKQVFAKKVIHPPFPVRSFMGSSLEDMKPEIITGLNQAASEVIS